VVEEGDIEILIVLHLVDQVVEVPVYLLLLQENRELPIKVMLEEMDIMEDLMEVVEVVEVLEGMELPQYLQLVDLGEMVYLLQ
jgi:hypothetical protein